MAVMLIAVLIALGVALVIILRRPPATAHVAPSPGPVAGPASSALVILQERFARGELSADEYQRQLAILREPPHG
ncbi:MAG: SHOCT domain-containing protein [Acidobacteriota bacterium]|nr:SHOCT domain-containing protein [Acidobacteriota bacterium]MDE3043678.1 SHOCT domain-containing protein [Acidobacteriota bacterium]MDE3107713.1 SHOCT domain-containing protein [Acidobacteriota bacterium]MDE3223404.1 SHOCT domain-containing protein [Acidobacteriota bacterium]